MYEYESQSQNNEHDHEQHEQIINVSRDHRASIHRRGAISAEVYTDEEVKNYTRKVN